MNRSLKICDFPHSFVLLTTTLLSFVVLFFISPDSPTHDFHDRCDSANFFMCGKAWMNGLIPYVDFTDSKGPLLWLIYGIGYLLSPRSYVGVFFLSVIAYSITYFYTYRIAMLFLVSRRMALLLAVLMTLVYFCPLYHYETRAEDFCLPFVMISLYYTCLFLYNDNAVNDALIRDISFAIGLCMGATLLIKYTVTAMIGSFVVYLFITLFHKQKQLRTCFIWITVGGLSVILPFVVLFILMGNFYAFIDQYFFITFITVREIQSSRGGMLHDICLIVMQNAPVLLLFIVSAITFLFFANIKKHLYFPIVSTINFILICIPNARWAYYFSIVSPFVLFSLIPLFKLFESNKFFLHMRLFISIMSITILSVIMANYHYYYYSIYSVGLTNLKFQKDNTTRKVYKSYSDIIAQCPHQPRIIYIDGQCNSEYGVSAEALPGCRDWSQQNGATFHMKESAWEAIKLHKADFVIANLPESITKLQKLGYKPIDSSAPKLFVLSDSFKKHNE